MTLPLRRSFGLFVLMAMPWVVGGGAGAGELPLASPVGVNLAGIVYFGEELPWQNVANGASAFEMHPPGPWNPQPLVNPLAGGYPSSLPAGYQAISLWDQPAGYHAPGAHVLLYDGTGSLSAGPTVSSVPGRLVFNTSTNTSTSQRSLIRIHSTDPADPVRNIRIAALADEATITSGSTAVPWSSTFTNNWNMMGSQRYMDWQRTNDSTVQTWSQRALPSNYTQGNDNGVALEHQIQLANDTGRRPWFNIPHLADDNYVQQMATMIRDTLDPALVASVEFSNEAWNGQFTQGQYAQAQGLATGLSTNAEQAKHRWNSKRAVEIFTIFEDVFTDSGADPAGMDRLRRVMGSQAVNTYATDQLLSYNNAAAHVDALAIAPYFGETVTTFARAAQVKSMTASQRLTYINNILFQTKLTMQSQKLRAALFGVDLIAYEGGQHFVGGGQVLNDGALAQVFYEMNRDPSMRAFYLEYLETWRDVSGNGEMVLFSSTGEFSQFGSWGLREDETISEALSPKLQGVLDFLARQGDVDGSSTIGPSDVDALVAAVNANETDTRFDLNDDGNVDQLDIDHWVASLANTFYGDANLNGLIEQADLDAVLQNWGRQDGGWATGDYNGDGFVAQTDLDLVLQGWGSSAAPVFNADAVPEPATALGMIGLGGVLVSRRRR